MQYPQSLQRPAIGTQTEQSSQRSTIGKQMERIEKNAEIPSTSSTSPLTGDFLTRYRNVTGVALKLKMTAVMTMKTMTQKLMKVYLHSAEDISVK